MTSNSTLAKETYAYELEAAKKYDDDQYVYVIGESQQRFRPLVAEAALKATWQKANEIFEEITAEPQIVRDDGIKIVPTKNGTRVLSIPDDNGNDILYAWEMAVKHGVIRLFKTKPAMPAELRSTIDAMISGKDYDIDLLKQAKDLAAPFSIEERGEYANPTDVAGVIESIEARGLEKAKGNIFVRANYYNTHDIVIIKATVIENCDMAAIERLAKVIGTEQAERDCLGEEMYLDYLEAGTVREQEESIVALHLETLLERKMGMIKEIVAAAEHLKLGPKTYVNYGDHDRNVWVHRAANKDIYVHNNIDRWENVYLLALNGKGNDYESIDIHISKPWYDTLHSNEIYDDEAMDWDTLASFIKYRDENGGTIREDQVFQGLMNDEKPGLVGSFDLKTGEFTRGPFFENTTVFSYLSYMIDADHNALTNGIKGTLEDNVFSIKHRDSMTTELGDERDFDLEAWLEKIGENKTLSI